MVFGNKTVGVSFNLDRPEEQEMYELAKSLKFSTWVKKYLRQELSRRKSMSNESSITVRLEE